MFNLSMAELAVILVVSLLVFGPGKLPEVGKALGRGIQEFRKATSLDTGKDQQAKTITQEQEKRD